MLGSSPGGPVRRFLSATIALALAGCSTPQENEAPVIRQAPDMRGFAFLVCVRPLRETGTVDLTLEWSTRAGSGSQKVQLRPLDGNVFCAQPDLEIKADAPVTVFATPDDMTIVDAVGLAYPSPEYGDDETTPNLTDVVRRTDDMGRFAFRIVADPPGVHTVHMGTVRPGHPVVGLFPIEKPAAEPVAPPPEVPAQAPAN